MLHITLFLLLSDGIRVSMDMCTSTTAIDVIGCCICGNVHIDPFFEAFKYLERFNVSLFLMVSSERSLIDVNFAPSSGNR